MLQRDRQLLLPLPFREREFLAPAHIAIGGRIVAYTIKRSLRRRTISLRIDEAGLRVGAPLAATRRAIENVLRQHGDWVVAKLDEWHGRRAPARQWVNGEAVLLLGRALTLRCTAHATQPEIAADALLVNADDVERSVVHALKATASEYFRERVAHFCGVLALPQPDVRLSEARTRWGSCHVAGRILLNWRIIQMPPELIDYVVAHEVAHLKEMNHSARFWAVVRRLVPDYSERRRAIRHEGHRYLVV